ncbi:unnamed protein product [Polarella glacialis]|uniref:Uncharacterized protein n=1 Tax=Polarella glacialis TaxID=89957 RepID=A0A813DT15_POLGL|nr:unnamed protein product [Polarella glacialis]
MGGSATGGGGKAAAVRLTYNQFTSVFITAYLAEATSKAEPRRTQSSRRATTDFPANATATSSFKAPARRIGYREEPRRRPSAAASATATVLLGASSTAATPSSSSSSGGVASALAAEAQSLDEGSLCEAVQIALSHELAKNIELCIGSRASSMRSRNQCQENDERRENFAQHHRSAARKLSELIKDWHLLKSSVGPRGVLVEYPDGEDWQDDVQVEERVVHRYMHRLIDGVPDSVEQEFPELFVIRVQKGGLAETAGIIPGSRLITIGMRSGKYEPRKARWIDQKVVTLTFEVRDEFQPDLLQELLPSSNVHSIEGFKAFSEVIKRRCRGPDGALHKYSEVQAMWEATTAFSCSLNMRLTRRQLSHALSLAAGSPPLAEGAADCLFDLVRGSESLLQTGDATQAAPTAAPSGDPVPSGSAASRTLMRLRCPVCEVCGGRGHSKEAPHLIEEYSSRYGKKCCRELPMPWGGDCGGHGHIAMQCPGLFEDTSQGSRCKKCLGILHKTSTVTPGEHPAVNRFLAVHIACEEASRGEAAEDQVVVTCEATEHGFHVTFIGSDFHQVLEEENPGLFVKVRGKAARRLPLEDDDNATDLSAVQFWASGIEDNELVMMAVVGLPHRLSEEVLSVLKPLGAPQGPVLPTWRALAAVGSAGRGRTWEQAHAGPHAAHACALLPKRTSL